MFKIVKKCRLDNTLSIMHIVAILLVVDCYFLDYFAANKSWVNRNNYCVFKLEQN